MQGFPPSLRHYLEHSNYSFIRTGVIKLDKLLKLNKFKLIKLIANGFFSLEINLLGELLAFIFTASAELKKWCKVRYDRLLTALADSTPQD